MSVAADLDLLCARSTDVVLARAVEQRSEWVDGRIVSYTRARVEAPIAGATLPPGAEVWIRTRGGVVDGIGQIVEGEALLPIGRRQLLFLGPTGRAGIWFVTERSQGELPLDAGAEASVAAHPSRGPLLAPHGLDARLRAGRSLEALRSDIRVAWEARHAK